LERKTLKFVLFAVYAESPFDGSDQQQHELSSSSSESSDTSDMKQHEWWCSPACTPPSRDGSYNDVNVTRVDAVKCQRQRSVQSMAVYLNHHVLDRTLEHAVEPDRRLEVTHGACVGVVKKRNMA
jgi:hypothetical protein